MLCPYRGGVFRVTQAYKPGVHSGLDVVGESSKELVALCDAEVVQSRIVTDRSDLTWQWGNYVTLRAPSGVLVIYAHLSRRLVERGQKVRAGDPVGIEGNTGYSFGAHCHLEVRNQNNRVTAAVNTPEFTGIPNKPGRYDAPAQNGLTPEEFSRISEIDVRVSSLEERCRVYRWYSELPSYARETIERLHREGVFDGAGPQDMQLTESMMRILLILAWRGII